jgi:hypothetical protein
MASGSFDAAALAARVSSRLKFPVASLEEALAQLGTDTEGVALRAAPVARAELRVASGPPTLLRETAIRERLQNSYFPLQSEADVARAIAAEGTSLQPVGTWLHAALHAPS